MQLLKSYGIVIQTDTNIKLIATWPQHTYQTN
jgi:hypothetical protein